MSNSQNGWPIVGRTSIASFLVPGTTVKLPLLPGDSATVLTYVAERFNATVEHLHPGWCWGYADRPIRASTVPSNHWSGTAIDLNAPSHPLGARGTFSAHQVAAIDAILAFCGGAVRWGGHYSGRKDEMHFEINASRVAVTALAVKIRRAREATTPTVSISHSLIPGTKYHREVMLLQRTLRLPVDGFYGSKTAVGVSKFKKSCNDASLRADYKNPAVGPKTCKALGIRWTG